MAAADGEINMGLNIDTSRAEPQIRRAANRAGQDAGAEFDQGFRRGLGRLQGSRNDFLNLIGSIQVALNRGLFRAVRRTGEEITDLGSRMGRVRGPIGSLGRGIEFLGQRINALTAGGLDGLILQIAAAAAGFSTFAVVGGIAASAISGLAAQLLSLSTALGGALLGGITVLGPGILALGAGAAVAATAFTDLDDATKKALQPFTALGKELRSTAQERLFEDIGEQANDLADALGGLDGFVGDVADSLRGLIDSLIEAFQGQGFQETLGVLSDSLPRILTDLGTTIGNLSRGLLGLFAAASPAAEEFFQRLDNVVERFAEWTESDEGRREINSFLQQAVDILGDLWDLITSVSETFSLFWEEGAESGQTLLNRITDIIDEFNRWVTDEGGREELRQWFEDGVALAEDMGSVLRELAELFRELDSPQTRDFLEFLLATIESIISAVRLMQQGFTVLFATFSEDLALAAEDMQAFNDRWNSLFALILAGLADVNEIWQEFITWVDESSQAVRQWSEDGDAAIDALGTAIGDFLSNVAADWNETWSDAADRFVREMGEVKNSADELWLGFRTASSEAGTATIDAAIRVREGWQRAIASISARFTRWRGHVGDVVNTIRNSLGRLSGATLGRLRSAIDTISGRFSAFQNRATAAISTVRSFIQGLVDVVWNLIGALGRISFPSPPSWLFGGGGLFSRFAEGGIVTGPTRALIGEAGPEAVIPLDRPLSLVDPAVRSLSALLQGLGGNAELGPVNAGGMQIQAGAIQVVTPYVNPRLVALEVMDALVEQGK